MPWLIAAVWFAPATIGVGCWMISFARKILKDYADRPSLSI